jgi:hypothetical protein
VSVQGVLRTSSRLKQLKRTSARLGFSHLKCGQGRGGVYDTALQCCNWSYTGRLGAPPREAAHIPCPALVGCWLLRRSTWTAQALADAEACVQQAPDWLKGHYRMGNALTQLQRLPAAVRSFERVLQLDATNEEAVARLAALRALLPPGANPLSLVSRRTRVSTPPTHTPHRLASGELFNLPRSTRVVQPQRTRGEREVP